MSHRKLIADLFARRRTLHSFFTRRLRWRRDAADLMQETYLRMLRAGEGTIENPEHYLLAVASNLVKEHAVMMQRRDERETSMDPRELPDWPVDIDYAGEYHFDAIKARLALVVKQLPARYQLVLSMTYDDNLSQTEIAERLGVSRSMVQKILTKAHAHCRARMIQRGSYG
jgi:RNA polymerase sigma factor (sigma-70 family)